eukprot:PRCOL_00005322-RA
MAGGGAPGGAEDAGLGVVWAFGAGDERRPYALRSIRYELLKNGLAVCTYAQPEKLNPMRQNTIWEMFVLLEHMTRDDAVHAALWTGEGRAFCAGADWAEPRPHVVHLPEDLREAHLARQRAPTQTDIACKSLSLAFHDFPKPSVVAVNGMAIGGGANMALLYHDLVVCSTAAKFKLPFSDLAITPELTSSKRLAAALGPAKAKEILLFGDWFGPEEVRPLVNAIVPPAELMSKALDLGGRLASHPNQQALRASKALMHTRERAALEAILDEENETILKALMSDDFRRTLKVARARSKTGGGKGGARGERAKL